MATEEVLKALQTVDKVITDELRAVFGPASSQEQVYQTLLLGARGKIQEAITIILRG